jgi:hypothetical protein
MIEVLQLCVPLSRFPILKQVYYISCIAEAVQPPLHQNQRKKLELFTETVEWPNEMSDTIVFAKIELMTGR